MPPARGVWVLVEYKNEKLQDGSLELVGEGRTLAEKMSQELAAVILGEVPGEQIGLLARHGAARILSIQHTALGDDSVETHTQVLSAAIEQYSPDVVLSVHSVDGADLAGRLAARLGTGLVTGCDRVDVSEEGLLAATRPVYGNKASATYVCRTGKPQMATVNPDAVDLKIPDPTATAEVVNLPVDIEPESSRTQVVDFLPGDPRSMAVTEADIVVAGGMGLGSRANFKLVEELADVIGGSVAATRPAVDEEWLPLEKQVGLTGKTVRPKLYIACGISGAIQHTMGMKDAGAIVAINKDRDAPIFKMADVSVVGDVLEVLPALTVRLREVLAERPKPGAGEVLDALSDS